MKRSFLLVTLLAAALLAPLALQAQGERILSFDSRIEIKADASLRVTEIIRVRAEGQEIKHGIYRDFPQLYRGRWGLTQRVGFDVIGVQRDAKPEDFHTEDRENGKRVYLGRSDARVPPGEHTYVLTYRTDRQLGSFEDHDELYWNVTGNGWVFPIDRVTASVTLPPDARVTAQEAYTGPAGAHGRDYTATAAESGTVEFATTRPLARQEGLTIVVSWPKGHLAALSGRDQWLNLAKDNLGLAVALAGLVLAFFYYVVVWTAVGRDPAPGTIIPLYGPPKGFSPAAVRTLVRMGMDHKAFAASLIGLAVKGAITLKQEGSEYTVIRRSDKVDLLPDEKLLMDKLLGGYGSLRLAQTHHEKISEAIKAVKAALLLAEEKVYFVRNLGYWTVGFLFSLVPLALSLLAYRTRPEALFMVVWLTFWTVGVTVLLSAVFNLWRGRHWGQALFMTLFSVPFLAGECFGLWMFSTATSVWVPVLFVIGAAMNGVFYHLLKAPTLAGRKILDQIDGFRLYLTVAEKDRLNLENPPERTPQLFELFLPYALALDVEQKWAQKFEDVLAAAGRDGRPYSPAWYQGTAWSTVGAAGFVSSLGGSMSSAISSSSTAPGSSSGGGGGGSSGGGGGGGGGGGW